MLIVDRVVCDLCREVVGQLFNQPAEASDLLTDKRLSPEFTVCPDCYDASEIAA
jgi:hypothetical protein